MQRKRYTVEFKEQVLKEVREVGNASQVARRHGLTPKVVYNWMAKSKSMRLRDKLCNHTPAWKEF